MAVALAERPGNGPSGGLPAVARDQAVSADGRWVAFASDADDLVEGDTNRARDLFVRDLAQHRTERVRWLGDRELPTGLATSEPTITAGGEMVAFVVAPVADAPASLSPGGRVPVLALWTRATKTTIVLSDGYGGPLTGRQPSISVAGRYLAYVTADGRVMLLDRVVGSAVSVSANVGTCRDPSVSSDGRYVAFAASATTATAAFAAGSFQVYRWSAATRRATLISAGAEGAPGNGASVDASISGDGRTVAFASTATNLASIEGLDGTPQVYAWREDDDAISVVSFDRTGSAGHGASRAPSVSVTGRYVAFQSAAPNLDAAGMQAVSASSAAIVRASVAVALTAVFVRDVVNGRLVRVSVTSKGDAPAGDSGRPSISADGMVVAYDSTSAGLIPGDTNRARDVFVRRWSSSATVAPNPLEFGIVSVGFPASRIVTVTGTGWAPLRVVSARAAGVYGGEFRVGMDGCSGATLYFGDSCGIEVAFSPSGPGSRVAQLLIENDAPGGLLTVRLSGAGTSTPPTPTPQLRTAAPSASFSVPGTLRPYVNPGGGPSLVLDPPIGPPGFVTMAVGTGFPAGARVRLQWDRGVNADGPEATVAGDGTFRVGMLVFPKAAPGPRLAVATRVAGPGFTSVSAPFLVVVSTAQPPASGAVTFVSPIVHPIIWR